MACDASEGDAASDTEQEQGMETLRFHLATGLDQGYQRTQGKVLHNRTTKSTQKQYIPPYPRYA
jgi:hypothetical protein